MPWTLIGLLIFIAAMGYGYQRGWFDLGPNHNDDDPDNLGPW